MILSRTAFKRLRFRCCSDRHLVTLFNSVGEGVIETGVTEAAAEAAVLEGGEDPLMMVSAIWFRDQPAAHLGNHHGGDLKKKGEIKNQNHYFLQGRYWP